MCVEAGQRGSISELISEMKYGETDAVREIWNRFFDRLAAFAQRRLSGLTKRVIDDEDVALSVLDAVWRGAQAGRFPELSDRKGLWRLLIHLTSQKIIDKQRHEMRKKRGRGYVRGEADLRDGRDGKYVGLTELASKEPTPEFLVSMAELHDQLLNSLMDETLREIAIATMEGYTSAEIASDLGVSIRTVQRKIRLIHAKWSRASV